ncbi:3-dehydroquinate synthase [Corynebacterium ulceribovis]|uniref:3-dehydroquinate synthase n=1 Tax=Corynebacterium ulceribovis TaxID=487732 RepID=UPI0003813C0B|nr:3-dehydroquinate synthase [Corynebacterium ulceribovis]
MSIRTIDVNSPAPYQVQIGRGLTPQIVAAVADVGARNVLIVCQPSMEQQAFRLLGALSTVDGVTATVHTIPDAEAGKTLPVAEEVWDRCGELGLGRKDLIIGIGGGAATDMAGFLAACWMRGIAVIQVPTSLLGMVDAAVGGKTGVNSAAGKNMVGAFHEPAAVFIDLDYLATLPEAELVSGSAEIIKAGFISDTGILDVYESDPQACIDPNSDQLADLIYRAIAVKANVVGQDLKEAGLRETLNYGHTFGHAVEKLENYQWRHGLAVAVGMMFEAELARVCGLIDADLVERHRRIISAIGLPTTYQPGLFSELVDAMGGDKKNRDGQIRFVALTEAGQTTRIDGPTEEQLRSAYDAISS